MKKNVKIKKSQKTPKQTPTKTLQKPPSQLLPPITPSLQKENFSKKRSKTNIFGKTFKKESYNPKDYENTLSVLLPKKIRNLNEENEKINLLNTQTENMEVNLFNLIKKREIAQKKMEEKFEDIYFNIESTKKLVISEGGRIRNELFSFKNLFEQNTKKMDEKHILLNNQLEEKISMKFEEVDLFGKKLEMDLLEESKNRKNQFKDLLSQFDNKIGELDNKIENEKETRILKNEEIFQNLENLDFNLNKKIKNEKDTRSQENALLRKDFWYELDAYKNITDRNHDKIVTEFNHLTVNLQKEIQHRLCQQDDLIDNLSNVVNTVQKTLDILKDG